MARVNYFNRLSWLLVWVVLTIPLLARGEILIVGSPMPDPILPHVVDYSITSSYQRTDQPTTLRILTPTGGINDHTRFLYLLPVQSGTPSTFNYVPIYGDGMTLAHQLQLNDIYNLVVVAPSFNEPIPMFQQSTGPDPWYGDNPSNGWIRQESYLVNDVVPLVDSLYPTRNKQRLLLGYSKSGWGALSLIFRHPDVFDAAASWDAPLMLNTVVPRSYPGTDIVFESNEYFRTNYQLDIHLGSYEEEFQDWNRLWLGSRPGTGSFTLQTHDLAALLTQHDILYTFHIDTQPHSWNSGWVSEAMTFLDSAVPVPAAPSYELVPYDIDQSNQAAWWIPLALDASGAYMAYNAPGSTSDYHTVYVAKRDQAGHWRTGCLRTVSAGACWEQQDDIGARQPSLAVDGAGFLHVFADHHGHDWRYFRSAAPGEVANISRRFEMPDAGQFTFPILTTTPNGDLYLIIRNAVGDHSSAGELHRWDNASGTWAMVAEFAYQHGAGVYPDDIQSDQNGDVHLIWEWNQGPYGGQRHLGSYLRYSPATEAFYDAAGKQVAVPVTPSTGGVVVYQPLEGEETFSQTGPGLQSAKLTLYGSSQSPTIAYRYGTPPNGTSPDGNYHVRRALWYGKDWRREVLYAGPTQKAIDITHNGYSVRVYYVTTTGTDRTFVIEKTVGSGWSNPVVLAPGEPIESLSVVMQSDGTDVLYLSAPTSLGKTAGELFYGKLARSSGTNLALHKPTETDSTYNNVYVGANAVDGIKRSTSSRWLSANSPDPHWLVVDLGTPHKVNRVKFQTGYNTPIRHYKIQYWDGFNWLDAVSRMDDTSAQVDESFTTVSTSKIRLYNDPGVFVKLYEIEIYGP